jgi:hypothetical protein
MSDEPQGNDQPQAQSVDLDALIAKVNEGFDKRFQGFQSLLDRRDSEYRQMLDDLKNTDLTPEERDAQQAQRLQQELDKAQRKIEILSMRKDHPEEVDLLEQFLNAQSLQDQLNLLANFRKAEAPQAPEGEQPKAAADGKPTPVSGNNPARPSQPSLEAAAERMNKDLASQIMNASGNDKGILARLRRQG